jgi:hypothetical protein
VYTYNKKVRVGVYLSLTLSVCLRLYGLEESDHSYTGGEVTF